MRSSTARLASTLAVLALAAACSSTAVPSETPEARKMRLAGPVDYGFYDSILRSHLRGGLFDYRGLGDDPGSLAIWKRHLEVMAEASPERFSAADRKAFWTNAYNTFCIEGILQAYPTPGPNDVPGFFDKKTYRVAKRNLTVNQMQYETLMPEFKDARLHFILVCSDFGCAPLERAAFTGADIEDRLDEAAYRFARDTGRFQVDPKAKTVKASKLFDGDWYSKDFTGDPARPAKKAVQYMGPWLTPAEREFLANGEYEVQIIPWDWRLNEVPPR